MGSSLVLSIARMLSPEWAHNLTIKALKTGAVSGRLPSDDPILSVSLWGRHFPNPIGLAAGFDKNAEVPDAMLRLGFGFVEIGSVTPLPQSGNPKPRLFRLPRDQAVINRMGFNNQGLEVVAKRLAARNRMGILGVNLGKNRDATDAVADYCLGVSTLGAFADYLVINISSPNTPGLRDLQNKGEIERLIERVVDARHNLKSGNPPILVKIAPDLTPEQAIYLAEISVAAGVDGMVISNTTTARPDTLKSRHKAETGGLSGKPLFEPSTKLLADIYRLTAGRLTLIGVGGVSSGDDAYAKIRAGASLVQLYTGLVYGGTPLIGQIKKDLAARLRRDGFNNIAAAVGSARAP